MPKPRDDPRNLLTELFNCAVAAADPMKVIPGNLPPRPTGRLVVIGAGKASARMAEAVEAHCGPCEGIVITRYGYSRPCKGIEIVEAAHPIPDAAGVAATRRILDMVQGLGPDDLVLSLISGGGSALLCAPADELTLEDKIQANAALLSSGVPISGINLIRKRLSAVKGGRLAAACYPAHVVNLIISDVPGDDPALIASGPTVPDTNSSNLMEIVEQYGLDLSPAILAALAKSQQPILANDLRMQNIETKIVAAPSSSLRAAAKLVGSRGYDVQILGDALEGEASDLGAKHARLAMDIQSKLKPGSDPVLLLSGGECTVTHSYEDAVKGVGGPNAEFVLSAAITLNGAPGIHILACDTDGVDGAAEIAGACAGPTTLKLANGAGISAKNKLEIHDSHGFFEVVDSQIITGPTMTNVNDFRTVLIGSG